MQITDYILSRLKQASGARLLVGIAGRAGAGKTTLAQKIASEFAAAQVEHVSYSGDWRFILDSNGRKQWLVEKWRAGLDSYLSAINQFRWWDFDEIFRDLAALQRRETVRILGAYERETGKKSLDVVLGPIEHGVILYENCILGTLETLSLLDVIILVNTADQVCLQRILQKDSERRSVVDIATRFLMTTYSENIFLEGLREHFADRTVACDCDGLLGGFPVIRHVSHVPVPVHSHAPVARKRGTVFCDLDGTLVKHVAVPSVSGEDIEVLVGSAEKVKELKAKGYCVVLTTSRSQANTFGVIERLRTLGLDFDQVICDLPVGPRHLINDSKNGEVRAIAHPVVRDSGIQAVAIQ